jgi:hypothetical protein
MLAEFIDKQELDILFLHEETHPEITAIQRYTAHTNLGNERPGTAILTKVGLRVDQIKHIPSGKVIFVELQGVWNLNVPRVCTVRR